MKNSLKDINNKSSLRNRYDRPISIVEIKIKIKKNI